jgi:hypothetical protein
MKTMKKVVGPVKTNIVTSTQFVLKTPPALPAKGLHSVATGEVINETGIENNVEINRMRLPVLGVKDSKGNPYPLEKVYNTGENGRGINALCKDYHAWSGVELTKEDLYGFDVNAAMKDQPVVVDIGYHVNGLKVTAYIKSFHPAGYTGAEEA